MERCWFSLERNSENVWISYNLRKLGDSDGVKNGKLCIKVLW